MLSLTIRHLAADEVDRAYVLARLGYNDLSLGEWRKIAATALAPDPADCRILLAWNDDDHPRGLVIYVVGHTVDAKPSLQIERLIAFDLMDARAVADALAAEVFRIARLARCTSFSLVAPLNRPADSSALVLASQVAILHQMF